VASVHEHVAEHLQAGLHARMALQHVWLAFLDADEIRSHVQYRFAVALPDRVLCR
jgi:hypothetical protein